MLGIPLGSFRRAARPAAFYPRPAAFYSRPAAVYRRPSALSPKMTALLALNLIHICTQLQTMFLFIREVCLIGQMWSLDTNPIIAG
jgi:hypothetical protein